VSLFYGSNSWHYYLTQALPILCTTALSFTLHGIYVTITNWADAALMNMFCLIIWTIAIYSFAGHKEWRFIHPLLPLLHIFAAKSLITLSSTPKTRAVRGDTKQDKRHVSIRLTPPLRYPYIVLLLLTLPASVYVVFFYCSAPISALSYLRLLPVNATTNGRQQPQSVGFLMPCHSTPGRAYLHRPTWEVWALGCEPPLQCAAFPIFLRLLHNLLYTRGQNLLTYRDQTDLFFNEPIDYITTAFPRNVDPGFPRSPYPTSIPDTYPQANTEMSYPWKHEWPRHLVFFGALLRRQGVREILEEKGYKKVWAGGSEWEGEGERKGGVQVWSWRDH